MDNSVPESMETRSGGVLRENRDRIDPVVVEALCGGDHMAFNRVYVRYYDAVLKFLCSLTKSMEDAQEITQEVFIQLWERRGKIDPQKNLAGLIYRLARNGMADYYKARGRLPIDRMTPNLDAGEAVNSEDVLVAKEVSLIIQLSIASMPEQRRRIFEMAYYQGLTAQQIADQLSLKKNSVQQQITYARNHIREALAVFMVLMYMA